MAHRECRHPEGRLGESGCEDVGAARPLGVVFVFVSVSLHQNETRRVVAEGSVSANGDGNGTRDECARVHDLRPPRRHPSQRDTLRSSGTGDGDHARAQCPHHDHGIVWMNGYAYHHEHHEHGGHDCGHDRDHARDYENGHDARDHPLLACQRD